MDDNNKNEPLLDKQKNEEEDTCLVENVENVKSKNLNPLDSYLISLSKDFYTLTWCCIKKKAFCSVKEDDSGNQILDDSNTLRGVRIFLLPHDYFMLYFHFIIFVAMIIISYLCIIKEQVLNDEYKEGSLYIIICRIILTFCVYIKLGKEFKLGWSKLEYTINNKDQFTYYQFAIFVSLFQSVSAAIAFICIMVAVCLNDTISSLVFSFSALVVLTELDDWLGNAILADKIKRDKGDVQGKEAKKRSMYELENLNGRMSILENMAMIDESNFEILVDGDLTNSHWIFKYLDYICSVIPFQIVIPLLTIPLSVYLPQYSKFMRHNIM